MGVAWYVALEQRVSGVDSSSVDGKALAGASEQLDGLALQLGLEPLSSFVSHCPDEAAELAAELGFDSEDVPEVSWFSAELGLRTVRGLLAHVRRIEGSSRVAADLEAMERVLARATQAGVRFHVAVDA